MRQRLALAVGLGAGADQARALEQAGGLQAAALEVALGPDLGVERVAALRELAPGEPDRGAGEQVDATLGPRIAARELGKGTREEQVADRGRGPAAGPGDDRWAAAPKRGGVEHVVVDEGRHVDELDRGRRPLGAVARRRPGAEQDEHRAQPLAARGERRPRLGAEGAAVASDQPGKAPLDRAHAARQPGFGRVEDHGHGGWDC